MRALLSLTAALSVLVAAVTGSQAQGLNGADWHLPLIGIPVHSPRSPRFHHVANSGQAKRSVLLTLTESSILAALNPRTGAIVWRQQLLTDYQHVKHLVCEGDRVFVSTSEAVVSLGAASGVPQWRTEISDLPIESSEAICWKGGAAGGSDVVTMAGGVARRFDGSTGRVLWQATLHDGLSRSSRISRIGASKLLVVTEENGSDGVGGGLFFTILDDATGTQVFAHPPLLLPLLSSTVLVLPGATGSVGLVWLQGGVVWTLLLDGASREEPQILGETDSDFRRVLDVGLLEHGVFVAQRDDGSAVVLGLVRGQLDKLWDFPDVSPDALFTGALDQHGQAHVARLSYSDTLQLGVLQFLSLSSTTASQSGMVTGHTFPFDSESLGSMTSFAIAISSQADYKLATRALIGTATGTVQLWEGSYLMWTRDEGLATLDVLPVVVSTASFPATSSSDTAFSSLRRRFQRLTSRVADRLDGLESPSDGVGRTLLIAASSTAGVVYGIDLNEAGAIRWRTPAPALTAASSAWRKLVVLPRDSPGGNPVVAMFGSSAESSTFELDTATGELLAVRGMNDVSGDTSLVQQSDGVLVGQGFVHDRHANVWSLPLPAGEHIQAVVHQNFGAIASLGRILGNRTTLTKYLNPHLTAVVTLHPSTSSASILLVDSSSGAITQTIHVSRVTSDSELRAVLRGNWLVYTLREPGDSAQATQVVSVELYSDVQQPFRSSLKAIDRHIQVLSRSFTSPLGLSVLAVTTSALGITSQAAIFLTRSGQVFAVPRRVLDPRRAYDKPTKADQEEQLLSYDAVLPADSRWLLSRDFETLGIKHAIAVPGRLESESIVVAFGQDVFATRTSPSRSFDVLSPTFNKAQLLITISGLGFALIATRSVVRKRQLRGKWYSE